MRVVTVLQTRALHALQHGSGEFTVAHVQALQKQVARWAPFASFECFSDVDVPGVDCVKLAHNYPGWWAKMNLFAPSTKGDLLYMDLDTVIVGPLDDFENTTKLTMLRDFYRDGKKYKEGLGSGLMFLPEAVRQQVWDDFIVNPQLAMMMNRNGGDQKLLEMYWLNRAARWQDELPGQVVSYKVHCANGIPPEARVICFHGKPRPWEVGQFLHLYRG